MTDPQDQRVRDLEKAQNIINDVLADGGQPPEDCREYVMRHIAAAREEGRRQERADVVAYLRPFFKYKGTQAIDLLSAVECAEHIGAAERKP